MHKKLFIPGPVDVRPDVLEKMATPMISHRGKAATELQKNISQKLQKVFQTQNVIVLSTTSGSGLMESAIRCCTAKRAAVFSVGAFGDRWYKMAVSNNVPADKFRAEDGKATDPADVDAALATGKYDLVTITHNETSVGIMNPVKEIAEVIRKYPDVVFCMDTVSSMGGADIPVDALGCDFCITSTQKCLGLPPGMSIASVSQKAIDRARTVPNRGLYLDIVEIYDKVVKDDKYQYPSTPSLSHMFAMDYQLDNILKEGLEHRWAHHAEMAEVVRAWARKYFEIFSDERYLSNTLTTIKNTRGISVSDLNKKLGERGFELSNGYGDLKEKTFRIAHMADATMEDLQALLRAIEEILGLN
ncbi:MAG: alanine--glyoxylate aminotransferase family protein [Clostridiaceae bacterium]|nr:alanine--glyoxylate aminotransferase family protein [Clostridiaceae bacterium]